MLIVKWSIPIISKLIDYRPIIGAPLHESCDFSPPLMFSVIDGLHYYEKISNDIYNILHVLCMWLIVITMLSVWTWNISACEVSVSSVAMAHTVEWYLMLQPCACYKLLLYVFYTCSVGMVIFHSSVYPGKLSVDVICMLLDELQKKGEYELYNLLIFMCLFRCVHAAVAVNCSNSCAHWTYEGLLKWLTVHSLL